jgi:hypothetical protein
VGQSTRRYGCGAGEGCGRDLPNDRRTLKKCGADERKKGRWRRAQRLEAPPLRRVFAKQESVYKRRTMASGRPAPDSNAGPLAFWSGVVVGLGVCSSALDLDASRSRHTLPTAVRACPSPLAPRRPERFRLCVRALEGQRPPPPTRKQNQQQPEGSAGSLAFFCSSSFSV